MKVNQDIELIDIHFFPYQIDTYQFSLNLLEKWIKLFFSLTAPPVCNATNSDYDCCKSPNLPCGLGEGDCDSDSECSGNLICGSDNCQSLDSGWAFSDFDCCMEGKWFIKTYIPTTCSSL